MKQYPDRLFTIDETIGSFNVMFSDIYPMGRERILSLIFLTNAYDSKWIGGTVAINWNKVFSQRDSLKELIRQEGDPGYISDYYFINQYRPVPHLLESVPTNINTLWLKTLYEVLDNMEKLCPLCLYNLERVPQLRKELDERFFSMRGYARP